MLSNYLSIVHARHIRHINARNNYRLFEKTCTLDSNSAVARSTKNCCDELSVLSVQCSLNSRRLHCHRMKYWPHDEWHDKVPLRFSCVSNLFLSKLAYKRQFQPLHSIMRTVFVSSLHIHWLLITISLLKLFLFLFLERFAKTSCASYQFWAAAQCTYLYTSRYGSVNPVIRTYIRHQPVNALWKCIFCINWK